MEGAHRGFSTAKAKSPIFLLGMILAALSGWPSEAQEKSAAGAQAARDGGTLRFGIYRDIAVLNPFVGTRSTEENVRTLIFESLLTANEKGVLPWLAQSWEISRDGKTYTFQLRRGVRFHPPENREMTAEDVKWSVEYTLDPKNRAWGATDMGMIDSMKVLGPFRLEVVLKSPATAFLAMLGTLQSFPIVPKAGLKPAEKPTQFPPGTGPYAMEEWKPGREIRLRKFPSYWQKGLPHIDTILLHPIADDEVRLTSVRAGDLDVAEHIPLRHVDRIRKGEMGDLRLAFVEFGSQRYLIFNVQKPPFDNVKLRQAIAYAIDKEEILRAAHWGVGKTISQKMPPGSPWYFSIPERQRDVEKTKALLREAGYPGGLRIKMESSTRGTDELPVVKAQLKEAGIELDLELMDPISIVKRQRDGSTGFSATGGNFKYDPDITYYGYFRTDRSGSLERLNLTNYSNPKVDKLLEQGRMELDPKKRREIYRQVAEMIHEEVPLIYLFYTSEVWALKPNVKGLTMDTQGRYYWNHTGLPHAWLDK